MTQNGCVFHAKAAVSDMREMLRYSVVRTAAVLRCGGCQLSAGDQSAGTRTRS
jgi:hypothetical protein